jgi:hypothetical protein
MRGGTARQGACVTVTAEGGAAVGAAGLALRRSQVRMVTALYYPGLQDPPAGHDGRKRRQRLVAGHRGQTAESIALLASGEPVTAPGSLLAVWYLA